MKKIKFTKEEDRDHKILAKEYKRLEIFIIIFMVIAICLGTFYFNVICFGPECENKSPTPIVIINPSKAITNNEDNRQAEWIDYILKQDNVNANINRTKVAINDEDEEINKTVFITKEQLKEIFKELSNYKIIKKYSLRTEYIDGDTLKITYVKNKNTYTLSIFNNHMAKSDDEELNSLIEKNIEKIEHVELNGEDGSFYVYAFDTGNSYQLINKTYDKYFN